MTMILLAHIVLMFGSLLATSVMTIAAATSHKVSPGLLRFNVAATALGIVCGVTLVLSRPLDVKCAILFGYTIAFGMAYIYVARRNQSLLRAES
ncbi:MAG: hypothetical protein V4678_03445 [Patescibacteria group bacterium]